MAIEPDFEGVADHGRHELHRLAGVEFFLHLPLELGVKQSCGEHEGHAPRDIFLAQLHTAWKQCVMFSEGLHCIEDAGAQTGLVRAALQGRNEVDVGFREAAGFRPGYCPSRAFAFGKPLGPVRVGLAIEDRHQGFVRGDLFGQVVDQPALVAIDVLLQRVVSFDLQPEGYARQQDGLGAQQTREFTLGDFGRLEKNRVGPDMNRGAGLFLGALADNREFFADLAAIGKFYFMDLAVSLHRHG